MQTRQGPSAISFVFSLQGSGSDDSSSDSGSDSNDSSDSSDSGDNNENNDSGESSSSESDTDWVVWVTVLLWRNEFPFSRYIATHKLYYERLLLIWWLLSHSIDQILYLSLLVFAQVWLKLHFTFFIHYFCYCVHHIFFVGIILISCSVFLWYKTGVTKNIRTKSFCVTETWHVSHLVIPFLSTTNPDFTLLRYCDAMSAMNTVCIQFVLHSIHCTVICAIFAV